jgi:phage gp36-like protein
MATAYLTAAEFSDQSIPNDALNGFPSDRISTALVWASGVADSYLRKRYTLPLISHGEDLKAAVADIAAYRLLRRRGFRPGSDSNDIIGEAYGAAIEWLREIRDGKAEIECVDSTPEVDEQGSLALSGAASSSFRFTTGVSPTTGCDDE